MIMKKGSIPVIQRISIYELLERREDGGMQPHKNCQIIQQQSCGIKGKITYNSYQGSVTEIKNM